MKIDLEQLRIVVDSDDPPTSALEMARQAHLADWVALAEKLSAEDVAVRFSSASRYKSDNKLGREAEHRHYQRIARLRAAGVDDDDIISFGDAYIAASRRNVAEFDERPAMR